MAWIIPASLSNSMINPSVGIGPNIATEDEENFFQSDRDILLKAERKRKQESLIEKGSPIQLLSKVLHFELIDDRYAYISQSGFITQKIDIKDGQVLGSFKGHNGPVTCLTIVDPKTILTCSWDKTIKKWNSETFECIYTSSCHSDFVKTVKVFKDRFYSGSTDSSIGVWDLETGKLIATLTGHSRSVEDLIISPDGQFLYSCSSDTSIRKWDLSTLEEVGRFEGHQTSVYRMTASFDDDILWSVSGDKTAMRWDLTTGTADAVLEHPDFVKSVAILPNGFVVTGCRDENIRVWNPSTEKCVALISAHFGEVSCIQPSFYSPGTFYSASLDTTFRTWELPSVLSTDKVEEKEEEVEKVKDSDMFTAEELAEMEELMDE